ncbi:MAG: hypothetical protein Q7R35_06855 [Elusimicrobiota bacterium]|nr:hypothetical protein [Elusimicrobiota bacterium]
MGEIKNVNIYPMRALLPLFLLLAAALPARAGSASVYYFSHNYNIRFDIALAVEEIVNSTPSIHLEKVATSIIYTNGAKFLISGPEDLTADDLARTTDYALESGVELIAGGHDFLLLPQDLLETFAPAVEESMSAYFSVERVPAQLLAGTSPSGIRFRALYIPSRPEKALWEPTIKMEHTASLAGREIVFTAVSVPTGLNGLSRKMLDEASDKNNAALLSIGVGGTLLQALDTGPAKPLAFLTAAGTDIAALDQDDLRNFWRWSRDGGIKLSSSAPEFICSNVSVSDPGLAATVKPYAIRKIGGTTVAFISLVPSNQAVQADLAGSPFTVTDPKEDKALYALINELRGRHKAKVIVAVSFLKRDELGWLMGARGIDVLIGPETDDKESSRKTRVEVKKWEKETHTGAALTVFPDSRCAGEIRVETGPRGELSALEALPPPEDGREPFYYREHLRMKERIIRHFLGSGDTLLPDLRGLKTTGRMFIYRIPDFFNLAAGLVRKEFSAEVSVIKVNPFSSAVLGDTPTAMVKTWLGPDEPLELVLAPGSFLNRLREKEVPAIKQEEYYSPQAYSGMDYYALSGFDGTGRVAGLPLDPQELYLTVLPAGLAAGKPFLHRQEAPRGAPKTLHEAVINGLRVIKERSPSRAEWEARVWKEVGNVPEQRNLWRINLRSLSLQMTNTEVTGPASYAGVNETRLSAVNQTQIQGSGRLFSEFYSGRFRWDTGISADYGRTALRPRGQPRLTTESVDQLTYESQLVYRVKNYNGALGQLVIGPYASAAYDTEFSRVEPMPFKKILRGSGGIKLFEGSIIQELYTGLTTEQVYTDNPPRTRYAAEAGFRLSMPLPGTALQLNADGNYRNFARGRFDTDSDLKQRLELNLKASTRLYGDIMISPFVSYLFADGAKLPGSASNLTTGFALEYSRLFKIKR